MENRDLWKSFALLLCLLPVVAFFAYWLGHRAGVAELPSAAQIVGMRSRGAPRAGASLNDLRRKGILSRISESGGAREASGGSKIPAPDSLAAICSANWRMIARTRTVDLQDELRRYRPMLNGDCLKRMREDSSVPSVQYFADTCQAKLRRLNAGAVQSLCEPKLASFKAYIVWLLRKGSALPGRGDDDEMAYELEGSFTDLPNASAADLDRAIALADGLIESTPGLYPAYKAKLVAMLLKEVKYGQPIDPRAYQDVYNELLSFDSGEATGGAGGADEPGSHAPELAQMDRDLVQLPFLRLEARGEYDQVAAMAQEYIASYPKSTVGYYYLAESDWQRGAESAAVATFRKGLGGNVSPAAAREMFLRMRAKTALERIGEIKLQ